MSKGLVGLNSQIKDFNWINPFGFSHGRVPTYNNISNYISPVQFTRMSQDIGSWRNSIRQAELAYFPMRVEMQRIYMDTDVSPYMSAVIERWRELILQRDLFIYQYKGHKKVESKDLTECLSEKFWFQDYLRYTLDAVLYGYTNIELREIVNDEFPFITITRRENIRPDGNGEGAELTSLVYMLNGLKIESDPLIAIANHYIKTHSNRGVSECGYGLMYLLAYNEIHIRHITEWNVDNLEVYGQPIRVGTTTKSGKDRNIFENFLRNCAQDGYIVLDPQDKIEFIQSSNSGTQWKSYDQLKKVMKGESCQLLLGHEDAISSTAGKLGGMQAANKDGFNESLIEQAMNSKQISFGNFVIRKINQVFAPKMRMLGKYVGSKRIADLIPEGYYFGYRNDKEELEVERRTNAQRVVVSGYVEKFVNAGFKPDIKELSEWTGITFTESTPKHLLIEEKDNRSEIVKHDTPAPFELPNPTEDKKDNPPTPGIGKKETEIDTPGKKEKISNFAKKILES